MSGSRKQVLSDAIKAEVGAAPADLKTLFTDDVIGWSPYVTYQGWPDWLTWPPCARKRSPTW